jgi:hypothetical protein
MNKREKRKKEGKDEKNNKNFAYPMSELDRWATSGIAAVLSSVSEQ